MFPLFSVYAVQQREAVTPMTQHWNVTTQRQFGDNWAVTASYFGNRTTHMWIGREINPAIYSAAATAGNINQRRLLYLQNPAEGQYFGSVTQLDMNGESSYHGGLFSMQKRFADGYSVSANYTLSRCMNDQDPQQFISSVYSQPDNPKADRGPCAGDRLHVFNATAVVSTPVFQRRVLRAIASDWQWATIYQASSGAPMNVTIGRDNALTATPNQRPDLVGDWKIENPTPERWFNAAAFALPAPGAVRQSRPERPPRSRNVERGHDGVAEVPPWRLRPPDRGACGGLQRVQPGAVGCCGDRRRRNTELGVHQYAVRSGNQRRGSTHPAVRAQVRVLRRVRGKPMHLLVATAAVLVTATVAQAQTVIPREFLGSWASPGFRAEPPPLGAPAIELPYAELDKKIGDFLQPWALAAHEALEWNTDDTGQVCKPTGIFRQGHGTGSFNFRFVEAGPGKLYQIWGPFDQRGVQRIYFDAPRPPDVPLTWNGDSRGRLERSDTLYVETRQFNGKSWLSSDRWTHTEELRVIERYRLFGGGEYMQLRVFVDDRRALKAPYTYTRYYRKTADAAEGDESVCNQNPPDDDLWASRRKELLDEYQARLSAIVEKYADERLPAGPTGDAKAAAVPRTTTASDDAARLRGLTGVYHAVTPGTPLPQGLKAAGAPAEIELLPAPAAVAKARDLAWDPAKHCAVIGPFRMMARTDTRFEIVATDNRLTMLFENVALGNKREVFLSRAGHPETVTSSYPGRLGGEVGRQHACCRHGWVQRVHVAERAGRAPQRRLAPGGTVPARWERPVPRISSHGRGSEDAGSRLHVYAVLRALERGPSRTVVRISAQPQRATDTSGRAFTARLCVAYVVSGFRPYVGQRMGRVVC